DEDGARRVAAAEDRRDGGHSRFRLLWHGRGVWLRGRQVRDLPGDRRAGAAAGGAKGVGRDADRGGRVQLSREDRTADRPAASAPGGSVEAGERKSEFRVEESEFRIQARSAPPRGGA